MMQDQIGTVRGLHAVNIDYYIEKHIAITNSYTANISFIM